MDKDQWRPGVLAQFRLTTVRDEFLEPFQPGVSLDTSRFMQAIHDRTVCRIVLGIIRYEDQFLDGYVFGIIVPTLFPRRRDPLSPAFLQERQVCIGTAQQ